MLIPYITIWCYKYDECIDFYKNKLGLEVIETDNMFTKFKTQGTGLYIHRLKKQRDLPQNTLEIHFEVQNADQTYNKLKQKGVEFEDKPKNMPWGTRMVSCKDPEGYTIEFIGPHKKDEPVTKH